MAEVVCGRGLGNSVAASAYPNPGWQAGGLERVVAKLELAPEGRGGVIPAPGEVLLGHAEREDVHMEALLATVQRRRHEAPDLVNHGIGHGEAADRRAAAVYHDERARAGVGPVEGVGEAQVER